MVWIMEANTNTLIPRLETVLRLVAPRGSWRTDRLESVRRRPMASRIRAPDVIIPRPPMNIRKRIVASPKMVHVVAVFTKVNPVTHAAEVAVKRAILKDTVESGAWERGSNNNSVPMVMRTANPPISVSRTLVVGGIMKRRILLISLK
jgi:hypothetical protein